MQNSKKTRFYLHGIFHKQIHSSNDKTHSFHIKTFPNAKKIDHNYEVNGDFGHGVEKRIVKPSHFIRPLAYWWGVAKIKT